MTSMPVSTPEPLLDVSRARALMEAAGLDALAVHSLQNVFYVSGHVFAEAILDPDALTFAVVPREPSAELVLVVSMGSRRTLVDFPVSTPATVHFGRPIYVKGGPGVAGPVLPDAVAALAHTLGAAGVADGRVGFELGRLPITIGTRIERVLPRLEMTDATAVLAELRATKSVPELQRIRHAARATAAAIDGALADFRIGMTEHELDRAIRVRLVTQGVEPVAILVATAERGAFVSSPATPRAITAGDTLRIDVTASYGGYHADIARTAAAGTASVTQRDHYAAVSEALEAAIAATGAGLTGADIFAAAVAAPPRRGFTDFERNHVGHGIGLQAHEHPYVTPTCGPLPPGAVLSLEVPYYVDGLGGFAPEDMVILGTGGDVERLTAAPTSLPVVG